MVICCTLSVAVLFAFSCRAAMIADSEGANTLDDVPKWPRAHPAADGPIADFSNGKVQGKELKVDGIVSATGVPVSSSITVHAYLGIPFGKAPIGRRRFSRPEPVDNWRPDVLDVTHPPKACIQYVDQAFANFSGAAIWNAYISEQSEDCLYLNVWVPVEARDKALAQGIRLPVMIWIYGGGFYSGSSSLKIYEGHRLAAAEGVIVVSMQYRLGMFGFAGFADEASAKGNAGLFDQRLSMEWVQTNINLVGGDPGRVTLFGESAGSVSVSLHLISPGSRNLFNRAILQSGTANSDWATISYERLLKRLQTIGKNLKCPSVYDSSALLRCFQQQKARDLEGQMWVTAGVVQFPMVPIVDGNFLPDDPLKLLRAGQFKDCPILIGSNEHEGNYFNMYFLPRFKKAYNSSKFDSSSYTREEFKNDLGLLFSRYPVNETENTPVGQEAILFEYTDWKRPEGDGHARVRAIDHSVGDFHFICPSIRWSTLWAPSQPVYSYKYVHRSSRQKWGAWSGVLHADEINFVFGVPMDADRMFTDAEKLFSASLMRKWGNFARTGNPNGFLESSSPKYWPKYTAEGREYLELSVESMEKSVVGKAHRAHHCAFWDNYLPQLMHVTEPMGKVEQSWKEDYYKWATVHMEEWKGVFDQYKSPQKKCRQNG